MKDQVEILRLKKLDNLELFQEAKFSVQSETNATLRVLYILKEIERRRAFAEKSYPSLYEFCIGYLGYKKGAAYRRISALKALKDLPEVEEKIKAGSLDLMTLSQAQSYFSQKQRHQKPLLKEQKLEILNTLESKSSRESEEFFLKLSPKDVPHEKLKAIDSETYELRIALPRAVQQKLEKLKMLMGAEKAHVQTIDALDSALDIAIQSYEKKHKASELKVSATKVPALGKIKKTGSQYISVHTKRQIWKKDHGKCSFVDPISKHRCNSRFRLEIDHIMPKALGGSNEPTNLRLVCRAHNQWAAIKQLGFQKMEGFIN